VDVEELRFKQCWSSEVALHRVQQGHKRSGCFQGTGDSLEKCSECTKCTVFIKSCKIMSGKQHQ
jgi:hypothetical protein